MKPNFILINKMIPFVFVVPPQTLKIQSGQSNKFVDIIDFGEISVIGNEKISRINFSTFIPNLKSPFYNLKNPLLPSAAVELLKKWKKDKAELTFTVPEFLIYYKCKIELLDININERTGDIHVSLTLMEQRQQNRVTDNITGLFKR
jgi:hypothetical protein